MTDSGVCRLCLSVDVPMRSIADSQLQIVYEKLTSIKLHTADRRPLEACNVCYTQLNKTYKLMRMAHAAHKALTEILLKHTEVTKESVALIDRETIGRSCSLTFSGIEYYDTVLPKTVQVKIEKDSEDETDFVHSRIEIEIEPTLGEFRDVGIEYEQSGLHATDVATATHYDTLHNVDKSRSQDPLSVASNTEEYANWNVDIAKDGEQVDQKEIEENSSVSQRRVRRKLRATSPPPPPSLSAVAFAAELQRSLHECTVCQIRFAQSSNLKKHLLSITHKRNVDSQNNLTNIETGIGEKTFECNICHISFKRNTDLPIHLKTHSGETVYECSICQRLFATNDGLQKHLRWHKMGTKKPHECEICQHRFTERSNLIKHVKNHSGDKPFECNICQRSFNFKSNLKRHLRVHNDEKKLHVCNICQHRCNEKSDLVKHYRTHTRERPYECNICNKKFSFVSSLRRHSKIHDQTEKTEKPYQCNICLHRFGSKNDLIHHLRTHAGEKPFECSVCKRCFTRQADLNVHSRTHSGEKPFKCDICQKRFQRQCSLKFHFREHTGPKLFHCTICKNQFVAYNTLQIHMNKYHSKTSVIPTDDVVTSMPKIQEVSGSLLDQVKIEKDLS